MNTFNPFQKWVLRRMGLKPENLVDMKFNVEQALRDTWAKAKQRYLAEGRMEQPDCMRCPLYLKTTPHEMTAFEQRPPTTEGKLQSEGIRYRALRRRWLDHPGTLMKHDKQMREQSQRATDGPRTERVPKVRFTTVKLDPMPPI